MPVRPASPAALYSATGNSSSSSQAAPCGAIARSAKRRTWARRAPCSSVSNRYAAMESMVPTLMPPTPPAPPATPARLRRSANLSTFAHMGAVYLFHDLYGYLMQMSADVLAVIDAFGEGADTSAVVARFAHAFEGQSPQQFVDIFYQHACLVEPDEDEADALWPMVAIKGRWNVWRRRGDRVTLWTAWGDAP